MDSTLTFRNEDGSTDLWRCRDIPLERLRERERNSPLGEAYLFWSDFVHPAAAFDFTPGGQGIDCPDEPLEPNPSLTAVFHVDCRSLNPFDFRIGVPSKPARTMAIRDIGPDHVRRIVALDVNYAKGCRRPLYQQIWQRIDGITQECYRLLLPILGDRNDVAEIFGFCRPRTPIRTGRPQPMRQKGNVTDRQN